MTAIYDGLNRAMKLQIVKKNLKIAKLVVKHLKSDPDSKDLLEKFIGSHVSFHSQHSCCNTKNGLAGAYAHCHCPWTNIQPKVNRRQPISRICIQQKFLAVPFGFSTLGDSRCGAPSPLRLGRINAERIPIIMENSLLKNKRKWYWLEGSGAPYTGTWAIVDVMCHELSHFVTALDDPKDNSAHGPKFYQNYLKLQKIMVAAVKNHNLPSELSDALGSKID